MIKKDWVTSRVGHGYCIMGQHLHDFKKNMKFYGKKKLHRNYTVNTKNYTEITSLGLVIEPSVNHFEWNDLRILLNHRAQTIVKSVLGLSS